MTQFNLDTPIVASSKSGTQLAADLSNWRDALHTMHSGSTAPAYRQTGTNWLDTTSATLRLWKQFDGTDWITLMVVDATNNIAYPVNNNPRYNFPLTGGTAAAYTLTLSPALTAYTDGHVFTMEASATSTGACTLNINGVGAKAIRKIVSGADVAIDANDIQIKSRYFLNYDSAANAAAGAFVLVASAPEFASLIGSISEAQLPTRLRAVPTAVTPGVTTTNGMNANGWYIGAAGATGNPDGTNVFTHHYMYYNSTYGVDDAFAPNANLHYRRYFDAGTWSAWQRIYDTAAEIDARVDAGIAVITYNSLSSYAFAAMLGTSLAANSTIAGSSLRVGGLWAGQVSNLTTVDTQFGDGSDMGIMYSANALSGSWRAMADATCNGTSRARWGLWFRYA